MWLGFVVGYIVGGIINAGLWIILHFGGRVNEPIL